MNRWMFALACIALSSCASTVSSNTGAAPDAALVDTPLDVALDTSLDAAADATLDATSELTADAPRDVVFDATSDIAIDVTRDATVDATIDATIDAAVDVTVDVAPRDVRAPDCDFATTYTFGMHGGLAFFEYDGRLAPGRSFTLTRAISPAPFHDASVMMCTTTLARCGEAEAGVSELSDVLDALDDPDVTAAFAEPPGAQYGADPTVHDTHFFMIARADGRGFRVGDACGGAPMCREIPAGLERLRRVLNGVLWREGRRPECAGIGPG